MCVVEERGTKRDWELVHRYCAEQLGPAALHVRRLWTSASSAPTVNPTLARLPAMIDSEAPPNRDWLVSADPLARWHASLTRETDVSAQADIGEVRVGSIAIRIVGYCAEMAAWIRVVYGVGD